MKNVLFLLRELYCIETFRFFRFEKGCEKITLEMNLDFDREIKTHEKIINKM